MYNIHRISYFFKFNFNGKHYPLKGVYFDLPHLYRVGSSDNVSYLHLNKSIILMLCMFKFNILCVPNIELYLKHTY